MLYFVMPGCAPHQLSAFEELIQGEILCSSVVACCAAPAVKHIARQRPRAQPGALPLNREQACWGSKASKACLSDVRHTRACVQQSRWDICRGARMRAQAAGALRAVDGSASARRPQLRSTRQWMSRLRGPPHRSLHASTRLAALHHHPPPPSTSAPAPAAARAARAPLLKWTCQTIRSGWDPRIAATSTGSCRRLTTAPSRACRAPRPCPTLTLLVPRRAPQTSAHQAPPKPFLWRALDRQG